MCIDMCIDMRTDMRTDVCADLCTDMLSVRREEAEGEAQAHLAGPSSAALLFWPERAERREAERRTPMAEGHLTRHRRGLSVYF